jgi:hypothetical protein
LIYLDWTKGVKDAKEMCYGCLPHAHQELVQKIHSEHLVVIEAELRQPRKSILQYV